MATAGSRVRGEKRLSILLSLGCGRASISGMGDSSFGPAKGIAGSFFVEERAALFDGLPTFPEAAL